MATINATISISSDISSYPTRINKTMTMKKAGSCVGLDETLGLRTKKFSGTITVAEIATLGDLTDDGAHKIYIRNASTSKENFFRIAYHTTAAVAGTAGAIGKLYGGDWMLMPYNGAVDINVVSNTTDVQYLEYMVFADGIVAALG